MEAKTGKYEKHLLRITVYNCCLGVVQSQSTICSFFMALNETFKLSSKWQQRTAQRKKGDKQVSIFFKFLEIMVKIYGKC